MIIEDDFPVFYRELDKLRMKDSFQPTGMESDRTFSNRIGVSHRNIRLYREGQVPDIKTIRRIANNTGLSEKGFLDLVYAAEGKPSEEVRQNDVPVYDIDTVRYRDAAFIGDPIDRLSYLIFDKPQRIVRASYRAIKVGKDCPFRGDIPIAADVVFVFNINRVDLVPDSVCVFADSSGKLFMARVIVRGRQIWLSEGDDEAATKVPLEAFNDMMVGRVLVKMASYHNGV